MEKLFKVLNRINELNDEELVIEREMAVELFYNIPKELLLHQILDELSDQLDREIVSRQLTKYQHKIEEMREKIFFNNN